MKEHTKQAIKDYADNIRKKATGGYLFGEIIDINDADQMIIAAYLIGQYEESKQHNPLIAMRGAEALKVSG